MSDRVVLHHDLVLALVGADASPAAIQAADRAMIATALREHVEAGVGLVVPAVAWPAILDGLASDGRTAAEMAAFIHGLLELEVVTLDVDGPALLLAADVMERHRLAATDAMAVALADILDAPLVTLDGAVAAAAGRAVLLRGAGPPAEGTDVAGRRRRAVGSSTLPDYGALGALLADLRRDAAATA